MSELLMMDHFGGIVKNRTGQNVHRITMYEHDEENYDIVIEYSNGKTKRLPLIGKNEYEASKAYEKVLKSLSG